MDFLLKNEVVQLKLKTLGGEMTSIQAGGTEYLWQADPAYWGGQAPILFPITGSLRNKTARAGADKICRMERHGVARKQEFSVSEKSEHSLSFTLRDNAETRTQFPFPFLLTQTYTLEENSICVRYTIQNTGEEILPFQIGGHPGFNCPLFPGERFEDYRIEFEQPETADCPQLDPDTGLVQMENRRRVLTASAVLPLRHSLFEKDALIFDSLHSRRVTLKNPKTGHYISLDFQDFSYLLIWSAAGDAPFVALEPWNGLATCSDEGDTLEEKRGVCRLNPGESKTVSFTIRVD